MLCFYESIYWLEINPKVFTSEMTCRLAFSLKISQQKQTDNSNWLVGEDRMK